MKCTTSIPSALFVLLTATAGIATAQTATTTTTTTSSTSYEGTVSAFNPGTFTVQSSSSQGPMSYTSSRTTTYVDEAGNPVAVETVRSGAPVTVYYTRDGDRLTATRVVVHKVTTTAPDSTTPTTTVVKKTTTTTTDNP